MRLPHAGSTRPMRVTLVTETYFPQVNGVSRTMRELARCLQQCGDEVQLICPDYGTACRSAECLSGPVDRAAILQRASSAAAAVRASASCRGCISARHHPHRDRGDVGVEPASLRPCARVANRFELSHQLRPVQRTLRCRLGEGDDLAIPALVSQQHARDLRAVEDDDPRAGDDGLRAAGALAARRRQ